MGSTTQITKDSLSFVAKVWWTLIRHQLNLAVGDNLLRPHRANLVTSIMEGYDIDIVKNLGCGEIHYWVLSTHTNLAFPY